MLVALLGLVAVSPALQEVGPEAPRWVERLGDPSVQVREQAAKRLEEMGEAALPALRTKAAQEFADAEARSRAAGLIESIEWKAAEKKFDEHAQGAEGKVRKWERLVDEKVRTWSSKFRIYVEKVDEATMPAVAAVARDGTIIEARGLGVLTTFLPLVFGESKALADRERRELAQTCMLVLKRSLPLKSGITVEPDLMGYKPERDERDGSGRLRVGYSLNYPAWGPHVWLTLQFGEEGRLIGFARSAWEVEWVYEKEAERLRREGAGR